MAARREERASRGDERRRWIAAILKWIIARGWEKRARCSLKRFLDVMRS